MNANDPCAWAGGIIAYVLLKMAKGKFKDVHPLLYGVAALFVGYFLRGVLEAVI